MVGEPIELSLRGLPEWLIREYLTELGGRLVGDPEQATQVAGDGWAVSWTRQRVRIPGLSGRGLTQFDLVFNGQTDVAQKTCERFMKKAQRGGG